MQVQTVYQDEKHVDVYKPKPLKNNDDMHSLMHDGKNIWKYILFMILHVDGKISTFR